MTLPPSESYLLPPTPKKSHKLAWILGGIALVFLLCLGGTVAIAALSSSAHPAKVATRAPATQPTPVDPEPPPGDSQIDPENNTDPADIDPNAPHTVNGKVEFGDGTYKVGKEIPAGAYKLKTRVTTAAGCYWQKATDSEGQNILSNDVDNAGRLEVTLAKGIYFQTRDCGI